MTRVSREIWYLSFEPLDSWGSGLATYYRHVVKAAQSAGRKIRIYQLSKEPSQVTRHYDGVVTLITVPNTMTHHTDPLGHWMNVSRVMADAVCKDLAQGQLPLCIEVPDGFGIGYFLLQRKLVGDQLLRSVPIVLVAHTPIQVIDRWNGTEVHSLPNWWTFRAEKWCFKAADAVVTLSSMLEKTLEEQGYITKHQKVYRSINPFIPGCNDASRQAHNGALTIGVSSRMVNWKGLPRIIRLATAARESETQMTFELCGEPSEEFEKAKRDNAQLFSDGHIRYLGCLDESALSIRRRSWTCQIHPSNFDNFPYSVLEALSSGLPCLIAATNGISEVLPTELRGAIICDFDDTSMTIARLADIHRVQRVVTEEVPQWIRQFDGGSYFSSRDALLKNLSSTESMRTHFPFIDADQTKSGLRPSLPIEASSSGARLTVVIPYYNMGAYIDECVSSVIRSAATTDVIIVNDGSTDPASLEALARYRNHARIRVIDQDNSGVATARNRGVEAASTEFVALLDSDDTVEPSYYAKAITVLDTYDNVGFVGCWSNDFEDGTNRTIRYWPTYNAEPMPNLLMNNTNCQALVYRRALYLESGLHDPKLKMYLDDWDGMLGMLEGGYFGVMLPEALFNYRQRKNSLFSAGRPMWYPNYEYIVRKRSSLFKHNALEALLFSNANGPNHTYHLLGWTTPARQSSPNPSLLKKGLIALWDALPNPVQRVVEPLADKIDQLVK